MFSVLYTVVSISLILLIFAVAIKAYGHCLTDFEESEIVSYPQIWYVGQTAKKVVGKPGAQNNNGMRNIDILTLTRKICGILSKKLQKLALFKY